MTHSDDDGLVVPPRIANVQVIVLPIIRSDSEKTLIAHYCKGLQRALTEAQLQVQVDDRDVRGGEKRWQWIKRGACCLVEIGAKEVENQTISFSMRDHFTEKECVSLDYFEKNISTYLDNFQRRLYERARSRQELATTRVTNEKDLYEFFKMQGGFALAYWSEESAAEEKIKNDLKVTVRCLPKQYLGDTGSCVVTGKADCPLALFAKAY